MGRLGRPHGLAGYVGIYLEEEHVDRVRPGRTVVVAGERLRVRSLRRAERGYRIAFEGILDREGAEAVRGSDVYSPGPASLGVDEYWPRQLQGLIVRDQAGADLGVVSGVSFGAAQDRLVVTRPDGRTFEVPFVVALVPDVDLEAGVVRIVDLPGLSGR